MPAEGSTWGMYRAMVGVGVGCALLILTVYQVTKPIIAKNRAEALSKAVFKVVPGAEAQRAFALDGDRLVPAEGDEPDQVYAGFDAAGTLLGVAVPASGMGYQDTIKVLYGYQPGKQVIVGFHVLRSLETPGLGDRIEKDPVFLANFEALDVSLDEQGKIKNPIVATKEGEKTEPWQVDGMSGATVSSVAVADLLRESSFRWPAIIRANVKQLVPAPEQEGSDGDR